MAVEDITARALCGVMEKALIGEGVDPVLAKELSQRACQPVVRSGTRKVVRAGKKAARSGVRKAGAYQKEWGRRLKALKKKHPRTSVGALMKRAHRETRKAMRK